MASGIFHEEFPCLFFLAQNPQATVGLVGMARRIQSLMALYQTKRSEGYMRMQPCLIDLIHWRGS